MNLSIIVCATKSYTYAMRAQARRVASALQLAGIGEVHVAIVGDESPELAAIQAYWQRQLSEDSRVELITDKRFVEGTSENYKQGAQLLIADMRSVAHAAARRANADWCWSLDSDTLPQANALRTLLDTCRFDGGFYSVAMCPYPNTAFLGGFGTPMNPIAEDFLPNERKLPWKLERAWKGNERRLKGEFVPCWTRQFEPDSPWKQASWSIPTHFNEHLRHPENTKKTMQREVARRDRLMKRIKECPPDGNVFQVNGKHGWRRRGWLDSAYPGIGHGAMVPTDWVGFGCTLMNRQALALAHFEGYEGQGTEDLFIGWHRWIPAGLRMAVLPHCPADHVIWEKKKGGAADAYTLHHVYHEQLGECSGHLRVKQVPWRPE